MEFIVELIGEVVFGVIGDIINGSSDNIRKKEARASDYIVVGIALLSLLLLTGFSLYLMIFISSSEGMLIPIIILLFILLFMYLFFKITKRIFKENR